MEVIKAFLSKEGVKQISNAEVVGKTGVFVSILQVTEGRLELKCSPVSVARSILIPDVREILLYFRETVAATSVVDEFSLYTLSKTDVHAWENDAHIFQTSDDLTLKKALIELDKIVDKYERDDEGINSTEIAQAIMNAARILAKAKLDKETIRVTSNYRTAELEVKEKLEMEKLKAELEVKEKLEMEKLKREALKANAERRCKYKAENEKLKAQVEKLQSLNEKLRKKIHDLES